jgi:NADPH-dependent curcumin reductase CurA
LRHLRRSRLFAPAQKESFEPAEKTIKDKANESDNGRANQHVRHEEEQQLAMLAINPPTAALLLSEYVDLKPGEWVLQNAANSGVGRWVIAFAKTRGLSLRDYGRANAACP